MTAMALFLAAWGVQSAAAIALGLLAGRLARRAPEPDPGQLPAPFPRGLRPLAGPGRG